MSLHALLAEKWFAKKANPDCAITVMFHSLNFAVLKEKIAHAKVIDKRDSDILIP